MESYSACHLCKYEPDFVFCCILMRVFMSGVLACVYVIYHSYITVQICATLIH